MSLLRASSGSVKGRVFRLHERTRIGRAPDNEIILIDQLVSRYHALIMRDGIHFVLRDLGSKNGMRVNGKAANLRRLHIGDQFLIGKAMFSFEVPKELKTARYSDSMVQMDAFADKFIKIQDRTDAAPPSNDHLTELMLTLSQLLEGESEDVPNLLQALVERMIIIMDATSGAVLIRTSSGEPTPLVTVGRESRVMISQEGAGVVLKEGKSALTAALVESDGQIRPRYQRALMAPFMRRDQVLGALYVERPDGAEYTEEDLVSLQRLTALLAGAVHYVVHLDQLILSAPAVQSGPYIGDSGMAQEVRDRIRRVASNDSTVLLTGETGTGKELVAHAIHAASERSKSPFVPIDCSAIPANLIESELFGHEAGAFTGADRLKRGKVEMAESGTLLLDEIGELQLDLQPKLLRFLEERIFYRVGGLKPIYSDVRVVAATNRNLQDAVEKGRFREDLLYRLNVMPIHLPPLRMRIEDTRALIEHFASRLASRVGKPYLGLIDETWTYLSQYSWPGNVRELRHSLERALILSDDGLLRPEHFQLRIPADALEVTAQGERTGTQVELVEEDDDDPPTHPEAPPTLAQAEAEAIRRALRFADGNRVRAAKLLKIHRNTLAKKISDYGISI